MDEQICPELQEGKGYSDPDVYLGPGTSFMGQASQVMNLILRDLTLVEKQWLF